MGYYSVIMRDGPLRYGRGSNIDSSASGQNATIFSSPATGAAPLLKGDPQTSVNFGGNGYYSFPTTSLPTGAQAWSIECWTYFSSSVSNGFDSCMTAGHTVANAHSVGSVFLNSHQWAIGFNSGDDITAALTLVANNAYYVCATYDGTTVILDVRGNGSAVSTSGARTLNLSYSGGGGLIWGAADGGSLLYSGISQEFAMYNYALSADQRTRHYQSGLSSGLLGNHRSFARLR